MQPNQPIQPLVGDQQSWPKGQTKTHAPYGLSLNPGEMVTRTWELFRNDAGRLIGISALPYFALILMGVGVGVVAGVADAGGRNFEDLAFLIPLVAIGGGLVWSMVLAMLAAQAGTLIVVEEQVRGEPKTMGIFGAFMHGLSNIGRIFGITVVVFAGMLLLWSPLAALIGLAIGMESFAFGGAALIIALPVLVTTFILSLRLCMAVPAAVLEDVSVIEAFRRSIELTINMVVTIVGIIPIVGALVQLASAVVLTAVQQTYLFLIYGGLRDSEQKIF